MNEQMKTRKQSRQLAYPKLVLFVLVMSLLLLLDHDPVMYAQSDDCTPIIAAQFKIVNTTCRELNSNWACYGHNTTVAVPTGLRFIQEGDRQPIEGLNTITTTDPSGAAVLHLHVAGEASPINIVLLGAAQLRPGGGSIFTMRDEMG